MRSRSASSRAVDHDLTLHKQCQELELRSVHRGGGRALFGRAFGGQECPLDLVRLLHQRTDGNPLFLVKRWTTLRSRAGSLQYGGRAVARGGLRPWPLTCRRVCGSSSSSSWSSSAPQSRACSRPPVWPAWSGRRRRWRQRSKKPRAGSRTWARAWYGASNLCRPGGWRCGRMARRRSAMRFVMPSISKSVRPAAGRAAHPTSSQAWRAGGRWLWRTRRRKGSRAGGPL